MTRFRDYIIVINNWNEDEYEKLQKHIETKAIYGIIGKEVGSNGTPHLQSFVYFKNQIDFEAMKKRYPRAHLEQKIKSSTFKQASVYCKKENDFWEYGELPADRNVNLWDEIRQDIIDGMEWKPLTSKYPEYAIKYPAGLQNYYNLHRPKFIYTLPQPYRPFQEYILHYVEQPVNDRQVLWIYDSVGGAGKSKLADHLLCHKNFKVFGNAKTADIALSWNGENVIFDYSRSQQDVINYGIIEDIKNGRVFSSKYQSEVKFYKPPHLIIFANFMPDLTKLSLDRWKILIMKKDYSLSEDEDFV